MIDKNKKDQLILRSFFNRGKLIDFTIPKTTENEELVRGWKDNKNNNSIELALTDKSNPTEIFTVATFVSCREIEDNLKITFRCNPAPVTEG